NAYRARVCLDATRFVRLLQACACPLGAMAIEIERKFLVRNDSWRQGAQRSARIEQGYFCRTPLLRARIRIFGDKDCITLKSEPGTLTRYEFEYEIPKSEAIEIITRFSIEPIIAKTRRGALRRRSVACRRIRRSKHRTCRGGGGTRIRSAEDRDATVGGRGGDR